MARALDSSKKRREKHPPTAVQAIATIQKRMAVLSQADQSGVASWFQGRYISPMKMAGLDGNGQQR